MWKIFGCILVICCVAVLQEGSVNAAAVGSWQQGTVSLRSSSPVTSVNSGIATCSGTIEPIMLEGETVPREACVYGKAGGHRVARYPEHLSGYQYAIAFTGDERFADITGLCVGVQRCAYSQAEDVFLLYTAIGNGYRSSHVLITDFTKYLQRRDTLTRAYVFEYPHPYTYVGDGIGQWASNGIGISENGRWAVVELLTFGFLRIDLRTLETRRVIAPGADYGVGNDPSFEIGVSNDGRQIAVVGWRAGIDVYEVSDGCGDRLHAASQKRLDYGSRMCMGAAIERFQLFPDFFMAQYPRFIGDGSQLSLTILGYNGYVRAVLASQPVAAGDSVQYLAFGDSYTSGEGELHDSFYLPGTNTAENKCHVSSRSYPYLVGSGWGKQAQSAACSGSRTIEVRSAVSQSTNIAPPEVISIGVGGNDIALMDKLKTCMMPGTCEWAKPDRRASTAKEIQAVFSKVTALIAETKQAHPSAKIIFVGYPEVINASEGAPCGLVISTLLSKEERQYMSETIRYLNIVLRQAAYYEGVHFADIETAYGNNRLCDDPPSAMNALRIGDDFAPLSFIGKLKLIGAESFHPTPYGHERAAQAILAQFAAAPASPTCDTCQFDAAKLQPSAYWSIASGLSHEVAVQIAGRFLRETEYLQGEALSIHVDDGTFAPGSTVKVELHSEEVGVGVVTANEKGGLSVTLELPEVMSGFHTVHLYGTSVGGESVDYYQVIYIHEPEQTAGDVQFDVSVKTSPKDPERPKVLIKAPDQEGGVDARPSTVESVPLVETLSKPAAIPAVLGVKKSAVPQTDLRIAALGLGIAGIALGIFVGAWIGNSAVRKSRDREK